MIRLTCATITCCSLLALLGCGDGKPALYPVKGSVTTLDGKPLAGAQVVFHPVNPAPGPVYTIVGVVDDDGFFKATTFEPGDGAPVGDYILTITWPLPRKSLMDPDKDRLEGRYANKDKSTLKCTVEKKAQNELPPITLK